MNEKGNEGGIGAMAQELQSIVIDRFGNHHGPFKDAIEATHWAKAKWPEQEQDDSHSAAPIGWDIAALWPPQRKG